MLIPDQNGGAQCCHLARVNTEPATCLSRFLCQPRAGFNCLCRSEHEHKLVVQVATAVVRLTSWWLATVLVMALYAAREQGSHDNSNSPSPAKLEPFPAPPSNSDLAHTSHSLEFTTWTPKINLLIHSSWKLTSQRNLPCENERKSGETPCLEADKCGSPSRPPKCTLGWNPCSF